MVLVVVGAADVTCVTGTTAAASCDAGGIVVVLVSVCSPEAAGADVAGVS